MSPFLVVLLTILAAALAGMVYSLLLAFASINLRADQTIGGTALNLLATAIAVVIAKYFSDSGSAKLNYSNKPFLFSIGGLELSVFVPLGIILLIISYVVLYKTRFANCSNSLKILVSSVPAWEITAPWNFSCPPTD